MTENNYCVYMHTNKINNKKYIGISSNVKRRWSGNGKQYYDQVFGTAIQKYGWDNFDHQIIKDNLSKTEACALEQKLIKKYNTRDKEFGYNRSDGGDCGSKGAFNAQLKRIRKVYQYDLDGNFIKEFPSISEALREVAPHVKSSGNIPSCCKGRRNQAYGFQWSYVYLGEKINKCKSREEIISEIKSKKVYQYTLDGFFVKEYASISCAKEETGISGIQLCVSKITETSGGYQWFDTYLGEKILPVKSASQKSSENNSKKVFLYDSSMNLIKEFASCKLTRDYFGISQSKLKQYINNHDLVDEKYYLSFN